MVAFEMAKLNCDTLTIAPLVSLICLKQLIYAAHQYDGCSYSRSQLNTAICPHLYSEIIFRSLINLDMLELITTG